MVDIVVPQTRVLVQSVGGPAGPTGLPGQSTIQRVAASAMAAGQVVRTHASGQQMAKALADLRTLPFDGVCLGDIQSGATGNYHVAGPVPANVLQLGAGVACAVGVDVNGAPVRATDPACVSAPNWIGTCDTSGNVTCSPRRESAFLVEDFGLVADGSTPNDTQMEALRVAIANSPIDVIQFGFGVYVFEDTIGGYLLESFPFGTIFRGQGLSDRFRPLPSGSPALANKTGTVLQFTGPGVGLHIGYHDSSQNRNAGRVEDIEFRGALPTGFADYPNINNIALEVVGDSVYTIQRCRFGGFRNAIALDGASQVWCRDLSFDGIAPNGYQDMSTNLGDESSCGIRMGEFVFTVGGSTNNIYVENCLFNNPFYGTRHIGGISQWMMNCGHEGAGAWALVQGVNQLTIANCIGEGQQIAAVYVHSDTIEPSVYCLQMIGNIIPGHKPAIKATGGGVIGLVFIGNDISTQQLSPVQGAQYVQAPILADGNALPITGASPGALSNEVFSWQGAYRGLAVNHWNRPQASLDVVLTDYSRPLLRQRLINDYIIADEGITAPTAGTYQKFRQILADTADTGVREASNLGWAQILSAGADESVSPTPTTRGSGLVTATVQATRQDDTSKIGTWRIRQQWVSDGATVTLIGSPVTELAITTDGAFVAPEITVSGANIQVTLHAHPTQDSVWGVRVEYVHAGF